MMREQCGSITTKPRLNGVSRTEKPRMLRELESRGFIQRSGGNRKNGFEYEIHTWDEYEKLKSGINILDEILAKLKEKEV